MHVFQLWILLLASVHAPALAIPVKKDWAFQAKVDAASKLRAQQRQESGSGETSTPSSHGAPAAQTQPLPPLDLTDKRFPTSMSSTGTGGAVHASHVSQHALPPHFTDPRSNPQSRPSSPMSLEGTTSLSPPSFRPPSSDGAPARSPGDKQGKKRAATSELTGQRGKGHVIDAFRYPLSHPTSSHAFSQGSSEDFVLGGSSKRRRNKPLPLRRVEFRDAMMAKGLGPHLPAQEFETSTRHMLLDGHTKAGQVRNIQEWIKEVHHDNPGYKAEFSAGRKRHKYIMTAAKLRNKTEQGIRKPRDQSKAGLAEQRKKYAEAMQIFESKGYGPDMPIEDIEEETRMMEAPGLSRATTTKMLTKHLRKKGMEESELIRLRGIREKNKKQQAYTQSILRRANAKGANAEESSAKAETTNGQGSGSGQHASTASAGGVRGAETSSAVPDKQRTA